MNGTAGPQNAWQFLLIVFNWFGTKTSRILAVAQGTLAIVAAQDGLLTQKQVSAILLGIAILTFWRAQSVSGTVSAAQAIVAQSKSGEVPLAQTVSQTIKESQK